MKLVPTKVTSHRLGWVFVLLLGAGTIWTVAVFTPPSVAASFLLALLFFRRAVARYSELAAVLLAVVGSAIEGKSRATGSKDATARAIWDIVHRANARLVYVGVVRLGGFYVKRRELITRWGIM